MKKAKFGLHSLNAEKKKSFLTAAQLAGGQMVLCHVMEAGVR